jgi:hypothetical protein
MMMYFCGLNTGQLLLMEEEVRKVEEDAKGNQINTTIKQKQQKVGEKESA